MKTKKRFVFLVILIAGVLLIVPSIEKTVKERAVLEIADGEAKAFIEKNPGYERTIEFINESATKELSAKYPVVFGGLGSCYKITYSRGSAGFLVIVDADDFGNVRVFNFRSANLFG